MEVIKKKKVTSAYLVPIGWYTRGQLQVYMDWSLNL